jgi:hypothetical protein
MKLLPKFMFAAAAAVTFWIAAGPHPVNALTAELTYQEKLMPEAAYYSTVFAPMPDDVADAVANGPIAPADALLFEDIEKLSEPGYQKTENGYCILPDKTAYVAVKTDFPGTKKEMVTWWFWWHALKDIRYKIWCPGAHYAIGAKNTAQLVDPALSPEERFQNNPQYPIEDVGTGVMPLSIRFVPPEEFGFDTSKFKEQGVEAVICGVVGYRIFGMTIEHSYLCHMFRKKGDGLELRSRFFLGKKLCGPLVRQMVITEDTALDMMLHCSEEFTHLAGLLPSIYGRFGR